MRLKRRGHEFNSVFDDFIALQDLFYAYSSNNFLHAEVEKLVAYAVDGMSDYTVTECNDDLFLTHVSRCISMILVIYMKGFPSYPI